MKLINTLFMTFAILLAVGCAEEYDDSALLERIEDLQAESDENTNSLKRLENKLDEAIESGLKVSVEEVNGGYTLTFSDGTSITIEHGKDGATGDRGPQGEKGDDGTCSIVSIDETADGTAYVIKMSDKEYTVSKGNFTFALKLEKVELSLSPNQTAEIPYTLTNADETTIVTVRSCSGYTAEVDQVNKTVMITAPAELPADGYVVITAVKNSTGEKSSQYVSFVSGTLTVTADAETVAAAGGTVTLTVNANCDYTVNIPESCTWISQVDKKSMTTSYVYLAVAENATTEERTATVSLVSTAGVKSVVIVQKGKKVVDPNAFNIYPDDAAEKLAEIAAMTAAELDGQTISFKEGEYTSMETLTINAGENIDLTITGTNAVFSTGKTVLSLTNVNAAISDLTFNGCKQSIAVKGGKATITECTFSNNNQGSGIGGAIYMDNEAEVTVSSCTFNGNIANYGGDIYMVDGMLTVDQCEFTGSEAKSSGACIAMSSKGNTSGLYNTDYTKSKAVIKNSTFTNIKTGTSFTDGSEDGKSGVISCVHGAVEIDDCTFDGCEGLNGTIVMLGAREGRWATYFGNSSLKMNNCYIKNSSSNRLGLIFIAGQDGDWSDKPTRRSYAFINNTTFSNSTSTIGNYGTIAQSGGNAGIIMMNNCTIHGVTLPNDTCNGYTINTDGFILVSNSTIIADTNDGFCRNGASNGSVKLINSIAINTKDGGTHSIFGPETNPYSTDGHCIYGPADDERTGSLTDAIKDATTASLAGYAWDETNGLVTWNGPEAGFSQLNASEFEAMFTGFGPKTPVLYTEASAGEAFYNWLVEIDAVGKDARGNSRGTSWWPGAYQN